MTGSGGASSAIAPHAGQPALDPPRSPSSFTQVKVSYAMTARVLEVTNTRMSLVFEQNRIVGR